MDRGIVNFFKDGHDLGTAFVSTELKEGEFFPFLQIQDKCRLSIFHPDVHPLYQDPLSEEELLRLKQEQLKQEEDEKRERERERRKRRRIKKGLDPDEETVLSILQPREDTVLEVVGEEIDENETGLHDTREAAVNNDELKFETIAA